MEKAIVAIALHIRRLQGKRTHSMRIMVRVDR